jgi:hypothetical protein
MTSKNKFSGVLTDFSLLKEASLPFPKNTIPFKKGWV